MISPVYLLGALSLAGSALSHTIFTRLYVNGVDQGHLTGIRYPTYDGPITDVTSNDLICNGGPNPLTTPYPSTVIPVPAGAQLTAEWHHTLTSTPETDSEDPVAKGHNGPIMAYLAKVSDATQTSVTGLAWFKIYEDGFSGGTWAVERLIANKGKVSFTVPSCIAPGDYFLRMELIALHGASSYPGAQFYMECAQIRITGGGSASPATVPFPGTYKGSDPGITINLYYPTVTSYTIPGPRPFTCGGSNSSTAQSSSVSSRSSSSSSSSTSTRASSTSSTSTRASSTSSAATGTQTLYGQCGGQGWTGPTTCASGTCKSSGQYYSQCLP